MSTSVANNSEKLDKKCETENCAQELAEYSEENKKLVKNCGFVSDRCDNKHKKYEPIPF